MPGVLPGGFATAELVGIVGAWIGGNLLGQFGPSLANVYLIPSIFGSAVLVFGVSLIYRGLKPSNASSTDIPNSTEI